MALRPRSHAKRRKACANHGLACTQDLYRCFGTRHARTSLPASAGSRITADTFVCITGAKDTPGAQRLNAQSLATLASLDRAGHTRFSVIDSAGR